MPFNRPGILLFLAVALVMCGRASAQEFRAMWADAFHEGMNNSTQTAALVAAARAAKCNAIIVQVRKRGDAYYRNGLEPVAASVGAGFDPLADIIQKAHNGTPRLEIHAWFVTYNIWNNQTNLPPQANHPYRLHPDWLAYRNDGELWAADSSTSGNYQFDPGHPEVQQHTFDVMMDVLDRYDVDGIHFDYIRYTSSNSSGNNQPWGYNPTTVTRYRKLTGTASPIDIASIGTGNPGVINTAGPHGLSTGNTVLISGVAGGSPNINGLRTVTVVDSDTVRLNGVNISSAGTGGTILRAPTPTTAQWLQWRRDQVTALVRKVYLHAWARKPHVRVSASLIPWGNPPANLNLSSWQNTEAYARVLQDWRGWMEEGILDMSCPMIYRDHNTTPGFEGWANFAKDRQYNRATAIGMGWYLNTVPNTITQIGLARASSAGGRTPAGVIGYSYAVPNDDGTSLGNTWTQLASGPFATTATIPSMPWKSDTSKGHLMGVVRQGNSGPAFDGATVRLTGPANRTLLSDGTGFYGAVDLPTGTYTVTVEAPDFQTFSQNIQIVGAQVAQLNVPLEPPIIAPFQITHWTRNAATNSITITWNSVPGRVYQIQRSQNLTAWFIAQSNIVATGSTTTFECPLPPSWAKLAFLRVRDITP